jgi:DNA-binding LacI/PurR family transcriptional regulator
MTLKRYVTAQRKIINYIAQNKLQVGDKLPPELEMAKIINCSSTTVRQALHILAENNFIDRLHGCGTLVKQKINEATGRGNLLFLYFGSLPVQSGNLISTLKQRALSRGYNLKIVICENDDNSLLFQELENIDGAIISGEITTKSLSLIKGFSIEIVVLGSIAVPVDFTVIENDWGNAGKQLTDHFIKKGAKKIALLGGSKEFVPAQKIKTAYEEVLRANNIPCREEWIMWAGCNEWADKVVEFFNVNSWKEFDAIIVEIGVFPFFYTYCSAQNADFENLSIGILSSPNDKHLTVNQRAVIATFIENDIEKCVDILVEQIFNTGKNQYGTISIPPKIIIDAE